MRHLFTPEGEAALAAVLRLQPLLAFDFDGTLAPIVARPDDAQVSKAAARSLRVLAARLPVAVVTGRAVADVRERLGFEPRYVVGSHGAEDDADPVGTAQRIAGLDGLRAQLRARAGELAAAGVMAEDKGASIALHFRLSRDRERARAVIEQLLSAADPSLQIFGGKMVFNAMAAGAPDKAQAVRALVERCGARAALFAGDDVNDEPVFASAPLHWLTLRIGRDDPSSRAQFGLDGPQEMPLLLQRVLAMLDVQSRH
jgi:trehalose 6-phosphate phosphatase